MSTFNLHSHIPSNYFDEDADMMGGSEKTYSHHSIVYVYDPTVGYYHYGPGHPMKPYRLTLTDDLVISYGLTRRMKTYIGRKASSMDLLKFHSDEYIDYLKRVTTEKFTQEIIENGLRFNIGDDCPLFQGLYDFCLQYTGCTLEATKHLKNETADISINWSGGLHHAKKSEASGFCYVNDITLSILELLKVYPRVLYIDIDVHHGDGVQEAFYISDRVLCLSFHKFGEGFFPGTGDIDEIGEHAGQYHSINVPLHSGIDDAGYLYLFKPIVKATMETYQPSVVVLQCGADSLGCDRLGCFNLSVKGHGECVSYIKKFHLPLLILGGGGYTIKNVSRCWAYETAILCDTPLDYHLPVSSRHIEYFAPDYRLFPDTSTKIENYNTREYLDKIKTKVLTNIRQLQGAPSVQFQIVPPINDVHLDSDAESESEEEEEKNGDGGGEKLDTNDHQTHEEILLTLKGFRNSKERISLRRQIKEAKLSLFDASYQDGKSALSESKLNSEDEEDSTDPTEIKVD